MTDLRFDIRITSGKRTLVDVHGFPLAEGMVTILFGESGIGKSLIGKAIWGLLDTEAMDAWINTEPYRSFHARNESVSGRERGFFVFQEPSSHFNPLLTLSEQVSEGSLALSPRPASAIKDLWRSDQGAEVDDILPVYPTPFRPSGGEKQRILAGMAFTQWDSQSQNERGGVFVFDEPTGSLDRESRDRFLDALFTRFQARPRTLLLITHDYSIIGYIRKHHQPLEKDIRFLELSRGDGKVQVGNFHPARFLDWMRNRPVPVPIPTSPPPLLSVDGGLRVYGRTFTFAGPGGGIPSSDLTVNAGDLVYLKAGSGVGKTTVVKILMGLQRADYFRMTFDGVRLGEVSPARYWRKNLWGKKITMAFQHADEALNPRSTVEETLSILPAGAGSSPGAEAGILARLFEEDEIPSLLTKKVWQLSGGQKQRLNLLRAFALSTPLLILDEPLSALDFGSIEGVLALMQASRRQGQAILLISHNEDIFDPVVPPDRVYQLVTSGG